jgi:hypothetical protein
MILRVAASRDPAISKYTDYLTLWQNPEDVVLYSLAHCVEPRVSIVAHSLMTRRLPKRAACFGREYLHAPEAPAEVINNALQDSHELRLQELSDKFLSQLDGRIGAVLTVAIQREAVKIRDILTRDPPAGMLLPQDAALTVCRFLAYPRAHDSSPPPALVIRGDKIERFGDRFFSYLYAGETSSQIGYLLTSDEWREIALIAFQNVLYRSYTEHYVVQIDESLTDPETAIRRPALQFDAIFRPSLEIEAAARTSKVRVGDVDRMLMVLSEQAYFDTIPQLLPQRVSSVIEEIADRFSEFAGEEGWKLRAQHVASFVSQFPPSLRTELLNLLRDKDKFLFLNRKETIDFVIAGLAKLNLPKPLRLVPLTPSSGQYVRTHIRGAVSPAGIQAHATIQHALSSVESLGGSVVFIDDNIASGTQAGRQLDIYMGADAEKPLGNYFIEKLDDRSKELLRSQNIGAAFAVGFDGGRKAFVDRATHHGIRLSGENVQWGKSVEDASGKAFLSEGMRTFLREVGIAVLSRRFQRERIPESANIAREFALGYGGLEGLLVTSFSVPTSTYPAFWCPGILECAQPENEPPVTFPWTPLFIRTGMLPHLVLG